MRRMQVHSHGRQGPCPNVVARVVARALAGERLYLVAPSRDDAEAFAAALRDRGVMGVHTAGQHLEIHPDELH